MRQCYQRGSLRRAHRQSGPDRWEFLRRENDATGKRVRRTTVIGTIIQPPTEDSARAAVNGLRMHINQNRHRQREKAVRMGDLVDHYVRTELTGNAEWYSPATRIVYQQILKRWIRPQRAEVEIGDVRTVAVEDWLRHLQRADGNSLAKATKAKIRNLLSVLFNYAIRYEWLEQGKNPITFVRQSAKRIRDPEVLEPGEIQSLLTQLKSCFRVIVILDATTGLRRSELFALKWGDVDFPHLQMEHPAVDLFAPRGPWQDGGIPEAGSLGGAGGG